MTNLTRRTALTLLGGLTVASTGALAFAQGVEDRKFVFVILRGGLDGLAALIPDDPAVEAARGGLLPPKNERRTIATGFGLHPALENLHEFYKAGEATFIHACSTPYRARSHFDGQDVLESLGTEGAREGWLNRALQVLPGATGLGIGPAVPLILRGPAEVSNWSPSVFAAVDDDLLARLQYLYAADTSLAAALATARETDMATMGMGGAGRRGPGAAITEEFSAAGKLMAAAGGPGIGVIAVGGWDTHANQQRLLPLQFSGLDSGLASLKKELGIHWPRTVVVLASEFGRTFRENGSQGTDHGTGGLVTLLGGAVNGGRMTGDWPGLKPKELYENRDLFPANDMVAILKGVLRDHLGVERKDLDQIVFPGSGSTADGLVSAWPHLVSSR